MNISIHKEIRHYYQYASDDGKFYITPSVTYSYYPNKNMPVLFTDGDDIILKVANIDDIHSIGASLSLNCKPVNWFVIQPFAPKTTFQSIQ